MLLVELSLSMKQLRAMAQSLSADAFHEQLGPIALIEQRKNLALQDDLASGSSEIGPTSIVNPELVMARMLLLALETEDLHVATLPPIRSCDELSVGRQPDCDLPVDDESVSKRHALLRWDEGQHCCTLRDLGSTNGTFVNSASPIEKEVVLEDGDIVSFGDVAFWFLLTETLYSRLTGRSSSMRPPAE